MYEESERKLVFLITIDALRPDHLKSYGYDKNTTPKMEKILKKGIRFENAFANGPASPSSFSAIFTSQFPLSNGGYIPLPHEKIPFPQILNEYDIDTFAIHSNPNLGRFFNYDRGYETFLDGLRFNREEDAVDSGEQGNFITKLRKIFNVNALFKKILYNLKGFNKIKNWLRRNFPFITDLFLPFTPMAYNAPYLVNRTIKYLNQVDNRDSLFSWIHFMDVHSPYNPPSENVLKFRDQNFSPQEREIYFEEICENFKKYKITRDILKNLQVLYDAQINFVDDHLAKLLYFIEKKYKDQSLIIITADHGESFYEHKTLGHQGSVYEELLHVPLFILEPGKDLKPKVIKDKVQLLDIAPTILNFFGISPPDDFQGRDLRTLMKEKDNKTQERLIISECYQKAGYMRRNREEGYILLGIKKGKWKYIFDEEREKEYLFNLQKDPEEQNNLIEEGGKILDDFRFIKKQHLKELEKSGEKAKIISALNQFKGTRKQRRKSDF
ncbi:MAG: sulfatase [Promethearchaeia archaeon]